MALEDFPRVELLVRPLARPPPRATDRAPRRRGRGLGEAGGPELRARIRREQDAEARVPGSRRAGEGVRHARLDRRRPVEPHAPGCSGRCAARSRLRARPGALGGLGRARLRDGRQHSALADHGRGRPPFFGRVRHRHPAELGGSARVRAREPEARRTRSPPARPTTRSAASGSRAGRPSLPSRSRRSASSSTRSSSVP